MLEELTELQNLLYAESKHSLLIVIQGMDGSGKDGLIRDVFGVMNPQGVQVESFKHLLQKNCHTIFYGEYICMPHLKA
jgi:polyphosphate kinase 2 (PPK2 family)